MVSVIVPAYNVAGYIRRAVESIQKQSLKDLEILIVDDGSRDGTGSICDRMAERDVRIDVFHLENGGAPAARNYALDRARGKYVYFLDGDDWAEPGMLADMVGLAEKSSLELVVAGFYIDTYYKGDSFVSETKSRPSKIYNTQHDFRADAYQLFDQNLLYPPWNKLFLRSRIESQNVRFKHTFWDDFPFVLDFIRDVERVGVIERAYYHFIRAREESETARWRPGVYEKREEEHTWMLDLYEHWGLAGDPASMEMIERRYIERLVGCIENVCNPSCTLTKAEKRALVEKMITSERAQTAVAVAKPRSRMMALMLGPIKSKNVGLALKEGSIISFVKRHNGKLFAQLKASR